MSIIQYIPLPEGKWLRLRIPSFEMDKLDELPFPTPKPPNPEKEYKGSVTPLAQDYAIQKAESKMLSLRGDVPDDVWKEIWDAFHEHVVDQTAGVRE